MHPATSLPWTIDGSLRHQRVRKLPDLHEIGVAVLYRTFLEECEFSGHLYSDSDTLPEGARTYVPVISIFIERVPYNSMCEMFHVINFTLCVPCVILQCVNDKRDAQFL